MKNVIIPLCFAVALLWTATASAAEEKAWAPASAQNENSSPAVAATAPTATWSSSAEAGVVATGGNTRTRSVNTKLSVKRATRRWDNQLAAAYLDSAEDGATTSEKSSVSFESRYSLTLHDYLFAIARSDTDRFSGYVLQLSETAGYGRRFVLTPALRAETEIGGGGKQERLTDRTSTRNAVLRLAFKIAYAFGTGSEWKEEAFSEIAENNRHTESVTSLSSRINGNLSMKASWTVTNNSSVPADTRTTDTLTSLTLVFNL